MVSPVDPAVTQLFVEAERKAQRFAAFVRGAISIVFISAFLFAKPAGLPTQFIYLVSVAIAGYLLLGIVAYVLAAPRLFRPWMELPLWVPAEDPSNAGFDKIDCARAISAGLRFRPLAETIRATLTWDAARPADHEWRAGLKREREAELLAAWDVQQREGA